MPPWDALPWGPCLHLGLFVHRVRGLEPGLYLFEREPADHEAFDAVVLAPGAVEVSPMIDAGATSSTDAIEGGAGALADTIRR